jgi:tetratricopeptide (TPR) repeat protein
MENAVRRAALLLTVCIVGACAPLRLDLDRAARAPELAGFGRLQWPITTSVAAAQRGFEAGVLQAYAFNEHEAVRSFKAALALDPDCAMCAWGVAWQLGPNINNTSRASSAEAVRYVDHALRNAARATPRERALIEAMALRYAHDSQAREARDAVALAADVCRTSGAGAADAEPPDPLDVAYAERMRKLADAHADDPDILSLYAEAEMVATRSEWWDARSGQPAGRIGEVAERIERLLPRHLEHTGINHYLIHALDAPGVARRAVGAADRLGQLAPQSPHLLHMPSHTYVRVGRYVDAAQVNQTALAADVSLADAQKAQGFTVSKDWRGHNGRFLWFAALMSGRGDVALATARQAAERAAKVEGPWAEYVRSLPMLTLLRLQRWNALVDEPMPMGSLGLAAVIGEHARGVALARLGRMAEARTAMERLQAQAIVVQGATAKADPSDAKQAQDLVAVSRTRLLAELALAEQRFDDALRHQRAGLAAAARLDDNEPPMLAAGSGQVLAEMLQRAGRLQESEAAWRLDLAQQPENGWALRGLAGNLTQQGRAAEAASLRGELDKAWGQAEPALRTQPR